MAFATSSGVRIRFEQEGSGEPVLLIPGIGLGTSSWAEISARLAAAGYQALAMEPRGSGESEKAPGPYTGEAFAADAVAVLDAAGVRRAHVVGLSMGGMIAQELAIRHPKRVGALVLTSTYARTDGWSRRIFELREELIRSVGLATAFKLSFLFVFSPLSFREHAELVESREQAMHDVDEAAFLEQVRFCLTHDTEARLSAIRTSTLVICGELDLLTSRIQNAELAAAIDGAELLLVPGASHALVWERADEYARHVIGFLQAQAEETRAA
jgi:pimeloyl-ACP methyl ester carboxylesterase